VTFYRLLTGKHLGPGPRDCDCSVCVNNRSELEKASELKNQNPPYNPRLIVQGILWNQTLICLVLIKVRDL